jgi:uncharacterized protein (DUF427 family)
MSANSGPGYKTKPEHRLSAKPAGVRVEVRLNGEVIADSAAALRMEEGSYPAVYYFPRQDVKMDRLERSAHESYCPFKGTASYYSFKGGAPNAVWTYEKPYDEMLAIREHLAFYPDKVDSITVKGKP